MIVPVGVVGHAVDDIISVDGGAEQRRAGGTPLFAARALAALGAPCVAVVKGAPLAGALELPARTRFVSRLDHSAAGTRQELVRVGEPFTAREAREAIAPALRGCRWVLLGGQSAGDFPPETIGVLAGAGLHLLLDGQGLARGPDPGRVRLRRFPPASVGGVAALKLNEAEAAAQGDVTGLLGGRLRELVVTHAERGAVVLERSGRTEVPGSGERFRDPTGAGDAFCALYALARSGGGAPAEAARFAVEHVEQIY